MDAYYICAGWSVFKASEWEKNARGRGTRMNEGARCIIGGRKVNLLCLGESMLLHSNLGLFLA